LAFEQEGDMDGPLARGRAPAQLLTILIGATFILVGALGFIPGVTSHLYGGLDFAGHNSQAKLLHIFQVSWLHNIVHLAFGLVGLAFARAWATARLYLIGGGVVYLVLWFYGLLVDQQGGANFVPFNTADNWLHFVLGVTMIGLGFATSRVRTAVPAT
jgi:arginine exporter protein ArgO